MTKRVASFRRARGRAAHASGLRAESLAAALLRLKLYRIVGRRVRTRVGEIDLIARRGRMLVFVEVKARGLYETAAESLQQRQRARLQRAAELFMATRPAFAGFDMRFDVVLVTPRRLPSHLADAWRP
jgi:putative endonuclease